MRLDRRTEALALFAIVFAGLALRLAWIAYADFQPTLSDDAGRYDFLGRSLAEGGGYVNPNGNTTMFWPPGWPFTLTAVYKLWPQSALGDHEVTAALVLNALLGAATVVITYAIARRAFGPGAALIAAALLAFFPSMIFLANVTLTETLFTFVLTLSLWLFIEAERRASWWWFAAAAIVAGYAALVRGLALALPVALAPFWWRLKRTPSAVLARVGLSALVIGVVVAPWTIRNYAESGALVAISSNSGVDFYIGHSEGADGRGRIVDGLVFRYPELPPAEAEARVSRDGFREGIKWAARHPLDEAVLWVKKPFFLWYRDDEGLRWNDGHGERSVMPSDVRAAMLWLSNIYYWGVMLLAAGGVVLLIRGLLKRRRASEAPAGSSLTGSAGDSVSILLLSMVAYWTLAHIVFFADPRFHAPMIPAVCIFAAIALDLARRSLFERSNTAPESAAVASSLRTTPVDRPPERPIAPATADG